MSIAPSIMRVWLLVSLALVLGTAFGAGLTCWEFFGASDDYGLLGPSGPHIKTPFASVPRDALQRARVVVENGEEFDFGVMDVEGTESHVFVFANRGNAPLKLAAGDTTCKCTFSDLGEGVVAVGDSVDVKLQWQPEGLSNEFHQSANILTNDPDRPVVRLTIHGWVTRRLQAVPRDVSLGGISSDDGTTAQFDLFSYYDDHFEIVESQWTEPESQAYFAVRWEPLPADEIAQQPHAEAGMRVFVTVKPGLPLGPVNQTIRLTTDLDGAAPVEVPLGGKVASDVSILGRGYDAEHDLLRLGIIETTQERTVRLFVLVRGPLRDKVQLKVGQVVPDLLQVQLGQPEPINQGKVIRYPLDIRVPRGSRPVSYLGSGKGSLGRIMIETTHPRAPELRIRVRFAVQEP